MVCCNSVVLMQPLAAQPAYMDSTARGMAVYIGYSYTLFFLLFVCLLLKNSRRAWARLEKILSGVQAPLFECVLPCLVSSACSSQVHQLG